MIDCGQGNTVSLQFMSGVLFELAFVLIHGDRLNQLDLSIGQIVRLDWNVSKKQKKKTKIRLLSQVG